jgi:spore coat polysaccharide biosynthesis protein SpsF
MLKVSSSAPSPTIGAVVQARMTSSRLPGKVLMPSVGRPLLEHLLNRLKAAKKVDKVIVATTVKATDDPVCELCERLGIPFHRGDEENCLSRFCETAKRFELGHVIRITADCPLHDPKLLDDFVSSYLNSTYDYYSNTIVRTFPHGYDMEIFAAKCLFDLQATKDPKILEHVTFGFYTNPMRFKIGQFQRPHDYWKIRLTVDTENDFKVVDKVFSTLYPKNPLFTYQEVVDFLQKNPEILKINQQIQQKFV